MTIKWRVSDLFLNWIRCVCGTNLHVNLTLKSKEERERESIQSSWISSTSSCIIYITLVHQNLRVCVCEVSAHNKQMAPNFTIFVNKYIQLKETNMKIIAIYTIYLFSKRIGKERILTFTQKNPPSVRRFSPYGMALKILSYVNHRVFSRRDSRIKHSHLLDFNKANQTSSINGRSSFVGVLSNAVNRYLQIPSIHYYC